MENSSPLAAFRATERPPATQTTARRPRWLLHVLLFVLTVLTTMLAGSELVTNKRWIWWFYPGVSETLPVLSDFLKGAAYAFAFLAFLTCHEFGHYFTARYHGVRSSLPYYIPVFVPSLYIPLNIGTFGAVIRLRDIPDSKRKFFDIGVAGPLAGFVVSVVLLVWGFLTLPPLDYLYQMNPNYLADFGGIPSEVQLLERYAQTIPLMRIGDTLLFTWLGDWLADPARMPNRFDLIHYPLLFVGYLTLFFTALNLLPIGQLDGGHVTYGLFGARVAGAISRLAVLVLVVYGGIGLVRYNDYHTDWLYVGIAYLTFLIYVGWKVLGEFNVVALILLISGTILLQQGLQNLFPDLQPSLLWLFYSLLAVQVIGLDHPASDNEEPLDWKRKVLGWLCIAIFIVCFTPQPLVFEFAGPAEGVISGAGN